MPRVPRGGPRWRVGLIYTPRWRVGLIYTPRWRVGLIYTPRWRVGLIYRRWPRAVVFSGKCSKKSTFAGRKATLVVAQDLGDTELTIWPGRLAWVE
jgi:hypothetical protein